MTLSASTLANSIDDLCRFWAGALEAHERRTSGINLPEARRAVARRLRVPAGTLENLQRRRIKSLRVDAAEKIRSGFLRLCEAEIERLSRDMDRARAGRLDVACAEMVEMEAQLEKLRETVARRRRQWR